MSAGVARSTALEIVTQHVELPRLAMAPEPDVELMVADLSAQAQVRQLASAIHHRYTRLDALINNAGALFSRRQLSQDGLEMTFALNHLAYFLLTNLLLAPLKAAESAPANRPRGPMAE